MSGLSNPNPRTPAASAVIRCPIRLPFFLLPTACLSAACMFSGADAQGQSLADVLCSIQERKIAVEQRKQVTWDYENNYTEGTGWTSSTQTDPIAPVDWEVTAENYPTSSQLASLTLEDRVKALNIAIKKFDELKVEFVNVPESSLLDGAIGPGLVETYTEFDLPSLGRADHRNYHQVLQALALQVSKTRVLEWPYNSEVREVANWDAQTGTGTTAR